MNRGEYTLTYRAEDKCGNEAIVTRSVLVQEVVTILFSDGTLVINSLPRNREAEIEDYGAVLHEYPRT